MRLYLYTKEIEMSTPNISYEDKKQMLEDIKLFSKEEHIELFRIIKRDSIDYSENSNGIFFDLTQCSNANLDSILKFIEMTKTQRKQEETRTHTMDSLRSKDCPL